MPGEIHVAGGARIDYTKFQRSIFTKLPKAVTRALNRALLAAAKKIQKEIKREIKGRLISSPEYRSLTGQGDLKGELGVQDIGKVNIIIDAWIKSIHVQVKKLKTRKGVKFDGGLIIFGINANFEDVLGLEAAEYRTAKGKLIPWLEWLLLRGPEVLISGWGISFNFDSTKYHSRTGIAVMVHQDDEFAIESGVQPNWSVPADYEGTENDNWVTRALGITGSRRPVSEDISKIIQKGLKFKIR